MNVFPPLLRLHLHPYLPAWLAIFPQRLTQQTCFVLEHATVTVMLRPRASHLPVHIQLHINHKNPCQKHLLKASKDRKLNCSAPTLTSACSPSRHQHRSLTTFYSHVKCLVKQYVSPLGYCLLLTPILMSVKY